MAAHRASTRLRRLSALVAAACTFAAIMASAPAARAEEDAPFTIGPQPVWFLMGGATSGVSAVSDTRGALVGGEASLVHLSNAGHFEGTYGDAYYDFGLHRTYASLGPEVGFKILGIDGGPIARFGGDRAELGATGRLFVTLGVFTLYGRYAHMFDSLRDDKGGFNENVVQIGAILKLPIGVWNSGVVN